MLLVVDEANIFLLSIFNFARGCLLNRCNSPAPLLAFYLNRCLLPPFFFKIIFPIWGAAEFYRGSLIYSSFYVNKYQTYILARAFGVVRFTIASLNLLGSALCTVIQNMFKPTKMLQQLSTALSLMLLLHSNLTLSWWQGANSCWRFFS